jgi:hypothetical protein
MSGLNCYGPWNGAVNVGTDVTLAMVGGSAAGCKSACLAHPDCEAAVVTTVSVDWEDHHLMCGLRSRVWKNNCVGDGHHDTWYLVYPLRAARLPEGIEAPMTPRATATGGGTGGPPAHDDGAGARSGTTYFGGGRRR